MKFHPSFIGLSHERFDSEWRKSSSISVCKISDVESFILAHYLRKRPGIVMLCLRLSVRFIPVGCTVFSMPPREVEKRYGGPTWELARLFVEDFVPRNVETFLIAKSIRHIQRFHQNIKHLVSYADPSAGHTGLIYLASNWVRDGKTDDERKSPRCDYVNSETGQKYGRRSHVPDGITIHRVPRISKYRYVYHIG